MSGTRLVLPCGQLRHGLWQTGTFLIDNQGFPDCYNSRHLSHTIITPHIGQIDLSVRANISLNSGSFALILFDMYSIRSVEAIASVFTARDCSKKELQIWYLVTLAEMCRVGDLLYTATMMPSHVANIGNAF